MLCGHLERLSRSISGSQPTGWEPLLKFVSLPAEHGTPSCCCGCWYHKTGMNKLFVILEALKIYNGLI